MKKHDPIPKTWPVQPLRPGQRFSTVQPGNKANLETIIAAAKAGRLCVMACHDKKARRPVDVLCAVNATEEEYEFIPLAMFFTSNPYARILPPTAGAPEDFS